MNKRDRKKYQRGVEVADRKFTQRKPTPTPALGPEAPDRVHPTLPRTREPTPDGVRPEHNFTGTLDEWEDALFGNAHHFNVYRRFGRGRSDTKEFGTFPEAIADAGPDDRALVYAVTASERFFCVERKKWPHFSELWEAGYLPVVTWETLLKGTRTAILNGFQVDVWPIGGGWHWSVKGPDSYKAGGRTISESEAKKIAVATTKGKTNGQP